MHIKSRDQIFSADRKRLMRLVARLQEDLAALHLHCSKILDNYGVAGSETTKAERQLAEAKDIRLQIYRMVKVNQ